MDILSLRKNQQEAIELFSRIDYNRVHALAMIIKDTLAKGGKVLVCGNGGSGSQADHFEAELVGRYLSTRKAWPCISLSGSGSTTSCIVNDMGGDYIFSRPLEAHGREGDVLLVLSTSGMSPNILHVLKEAKKRGITSLALLGKSGGSAKELADEAYVVPSNSTARIQEAHIHIIHCICDYLETG